MQNETTPKVNATELVKRPFPSDEVWDKMTIRQKLEWSGLGTWKKNPPKAIQIVGAMPPDRNKL